VTRPAASLLFFAAAMHGRRHDRVRELLKRELSLLLQREFLPAQTGLIAVHDVAVSGDLKSAVVYLGFVGTAEQRKRGWALVLEHRLRLQSLLGHAVRLKYTPRLRFVQDDSIERGDRVLRLIEEIEKTLPPEPS
jgi:ribosome-binding factor A